MRQLTEAEIKQIINRPRPDYDFDYSDEDYAKAWDHRELNRAVRIYNSVLPAFAWYKKTGSKNVMTEFGVSIYSVLLVDLFYDEIQRLL